jgi:CheY-like chemotaxis protein
MRILIADDEPIGRTFLTRILGKWGHDVTAVADGDAAWSVLQQKNAPQLLILDWMMPGVSGVEVCSRLRKEPDRPYSYVILLTARHDAHDVVEGLESGADAYLSKPIGPPELRERVRAGERILTLQERLQDRIKDLERQLRGEEPEPEPTPVSEPIVLEESSFADAPGPLRKAPVMLREILTKLGADATAWEGGTADEPAFQAHATIILRRTEVCVGVDMQVSRKAAESLYGGVSGKTSQDDSDLTKALADVLMTCQGALRFAFDEEGFDPITPFPPQATTIALSKAPPSSAASFRVGGAIRFAFAQSGARIVMTPIRDLRVGNILADPIRDEGPVQLEFLSAGTVLNDRYIGRIKDLVSSGRIKLGAVPVLTAEMA